MSIGYFSEGNIGWDAYCQGILSGGLFVQGFWRRSFELERLSGHTQYLELVMQGAGLRQRQNKAEFISAYNHLNFRVEFLMYKFQLLCYFMKKKIFPFRRDFLLF